MDALSTGLLRMISVTGGIHANHDAVRKQRLDEMVDEGFLTLEEAILRLPDQPAPEPTYRLTEKGRLLLVV